MSEDFYHLLSTHRLEVVEVIRRRYPSAHQQPKAVVPTARLITVEQGRIDYYAENQVYSIKAPAAFFVPVWCKRHWQSRSKQAPVLHWISFSLPFIHPLISKATLGWTPLFSWESDCFQRIRQRWDGHPQFNPAIETDLKTLLIAFFESASTVEPQQEEPAGSGLAEVRQLIHWLENNYQAPQALIRIGTEHQLNPDYFRRLFKRETGVTPGAYLNRLRMQAARYYLHDTPLRIQEIAHRVGLHDQRYFARQYRAFWGKSPSEERVEI